MRFDPNWLKELPPGAFSMQRDIRIQEVDATGIVYFARCFEFASDAFVSFCAAYGIALAEVLRDRQWGAPFRHAEADYFKPLRFGDCAQISIVGRHVETTEVTLGYRIARLSDQSVAAVVQASQVFVDGTTFERRPIPSDVRGVLESACRPWPAG